MTQTARQEQTRAAPAALAPRRRTAASGCRAGATPRSHVGAALGPIAGPERILPVAEPPRTRSGEITRRLPRDVAENRAPGDATPLTDAGVMDPIQAKLPAAPARN
ncbi:hypothetical protein ACF09H_00240 [Streptomyces sp. NPDC014983]|uniref:hypothetical protein n=1 Tax=Streptomyces sp. NPDC014983 TaxID=3364933 RepID=UPI0036FCCFA3